MTKEITTADIIAGIDQSRENGLMIAILIIRKLSAQVAARDDHGENCDSCVVLQDAVEMILQELDKAL